MEQLKKLKTSSDESSSSSSSSWGHNIRPKSDKASILIDTKQILKDLMTQVDRLKAEYVTLSQESREVDD
ncbi:hypothetical protein YC2023_007123 [Brassica napus]